MAGAGGCSRHPSHRQSAGVCPFCLLDRLSRLPSAAAGASASSPSSSASASSTRSLGEESVAAAAEPCRQARRTRLGLLMRQEEAAAGRHGQEEAAAAGEKIKAKRINFWARLQQGSWYRKVDGCSLAHYKTTSAVATQRTAAVAPKRAPLF